MTLGRDGQRCDARVHGRSYKKSEMRRVSQRVFVAPGLKQFKISKSK